MPREIAHRLLDKIACRLFGKLLRGIGALSCDPVSPILGRRGNFLEGRRIIATKTIVLLHPAAKDLDALPKTIRESGLIRYAVFGEGDVKRLPDRPGLRLRLGRYRVPIAEDATTVLAIYIGKRETTTYSRDRGAHR